MKPEAQKVSRLGRLVKWIASNPSGVSLALWGLGWASLTLAVVLAVPEGWRAVVSLASVGLAAVGAGGARHLALLWWHGFAVAAAAGRKAAQPPQPDRKVSWR